MRYRIHVLLVQFGVLFFIFASVAHAANTFSIHFEKNSYILGPVGTASVGVILQEVISGPDTFKIGDGGTTFSTLQFRVDWSQSIGTQLAVISNTTDISPANGLTLSTRNLDSGSQFARLRMNGNVSSFSNTAADTRHALISTLLFTGSPGVNFPFSVTSIVLDDYDGDGPGTPDVEYAGGGSDYSTFGSGTISNPEPSTLGITALGVVGAAGVWFRRRRKTRRA